MRQLARKGFDLIIGTTFEYGPTMDSLSQEFPKVNWLHVSGYRNNGNMLSALCAYSIEFVFQCAAFFRSNQRPGSLYYHPPDLPAASVCRFAFNISISGLINFRC